MGQKKLWILVKAERGIPASITFFKKRATALAAEKRLRRRMHLDYDDTGLFEADLNELLARDKLSLEA